MLSCDSDADIEDEFFPALALLKSTAENSAAKLRKMLLMTIVRRNKCCNHDTRIPVISSTCNNTNEILKSKIDSQIGQELRTFENIHCDSIEGNNREDTNEIPTISIPDEESTDFITCKICDGAKIGPFILLECQDCLDPYHPLCHQPPVIEIDVYDPRLVWRCSRCSNVNEVMAPHISTVLNSLDEHGNTTNYKRVTKTNNENTSLETHSIEQSQNQLLVRDSNSKHAIRKYNKKDKNCSSGNYLRKRIGSKLTVSYTNMK